MIENLDQNQIFLIITLMAASAFIVGFMAGLFGIGGGLIMVPILYYIYSFVGIEQTYVMHLALGTSFSIIFPTSLTLTSSSFPTLQIIPLSFENNNLKNALIASLT